MSSKHEKSFVDFEKPYEQNLIGLKGILYFGLGLLLLIVITFGLMWAFLGVLEEYAKDEKQSNNPIPLSEKEKLPPEPRLQAAPGFKVDGPNGPVNLELKAPQAEYRELRKQWESVWEEGQKDARTGTIITMPIDKAKELVMEKNLKAKSGPEAEKAAKEPSMFLSDASAGRVASLRRR
ncbi:MAG: hypothetical protein HOP17_10190 [Acidobacteria bacterium]|nr:hypothetical protein [Acidobacteriota bacterium]